MGELTGGMVLLTGLALAGLVIVLGVFCGVALLLSAGVRRIRPQCSARRASLLGSSVLPGLSVLLFIAAFATALEPDFRGPEVLGIAIVGSVAAFSVILGWPVSYFVARRVMARRHSQSSILLR